MVTYNIDDRYCPEGHKWIFVGSSLLFSDCYYCPNCDKIYQPKVEEVTKEWFNKTFSSDRFGEIKQRVLMIEATDKVTKADLIKLGYLKEPK